MPPVQLRTPAELRSLVLQADCPRGSSVPAHRDGGRVAATDCVYEVCDRQAGVFARYFAGRFTDIELAVHENYFHRGLGMHVSRDSARKIAQEKMEEYTARAMKNVIDRNANDWSKLGGEMSDSYRLYIPTPERGGAYALWLEAVAVGMESAQMLACGLAWEYVVKGISLDRVVNKAPDYCADPHLAALGMPVRAKMEAGQPLGDWIRGEYKAILSAYSPPEEGRKGLARAIETGRAAAVIQRLQPPLGDWCALNGQGSYSAESIYAKPVDVIGADVLYPLVPRRGTSAWLLCMSGVYQANAYALGYLKSLYKEEVWRKREAWGFRSTTTLDMMHAAGQSLER